MNSVAVADMASQPLYSGKIGNVTASDEDIPTATYEVSCVENDFRLIDHILHWFAVR